MLLFHFSFLRITFKGEKNFKMKNLVNVKKILKCERFCKITRHSSHRT